MIRQPKTPGRWERRQLISTNAGVPDVPLAKCVTLGIAQSRSLNFSACKMGITKMLSS